MDDQETDDSARTTCPFCKELILRDASKCRFCRSTLKASSKDDPPEADRITYVLDRDLVRFAKFAASVIAVLLVDFLNDRYNSKPQIIQGF